MKQNTENRDQEQTSRSQTQGTPTTPQDAAKSNPQEEKTDRDAQKAKAEAERTDRNKTQQETERKPSTGSNREQNESGQRK